MLTKYELKILKEVRKGLKLHEKILLVIFKKYTFKIYQKGFRDKYFKK